MDENIIRIKYRYLQSNLHDIRNKLEMIDAITEDLKIDLKEGIIIDNKFVEEDTFASVIELHKGVYENLTMEVIPIVSQRC